MIFKEEVCMWFKNNQPHHRLGLICGVLNMCVPLELKFIRTYLEDLGKRDDVLKDSHARANSAKDVKQFGKVLDQRTCSKLIVYIALLEADNQPCSKIIYEKLSDCSVKLETDILANPSSSETLIAQLLLLYTMVLNHPAFTCEEKRFIGEKLTSLQQLQENINLAQTDTWSKQPIGKEACPSSSPGPKGSCQLDQTPGQSNQNGEACDSGLSIGTEPEGEMLSDHSCVPTQQVQQSVTIPSKVVNDSTREEKGFSQKWPVENNGCAHNVMSPIVRAPSNPRVGQSSHLPVTPPVQGAMSSSSGESLNLCSEPSSVPTTYIYNSNIVERNALNETASASSLPMKKKSSGCENQFGSHKLQKVTSSQCSPLSSPYVSPPQSLNPSRVASPKSTTTVTASATCVDTTVVPVFTPVVVSTSAKSTNRQLPPRQGSSSSSGSSHPSSPALINTLNTTLKKPQPVINKRFNAQDRTTRPPAVTLPVTAGDSGSVRPGSYSSTIAFFPSLDSADESQLTLDELSLEDPPMVSSTDVTKPVDHKVATSSTTVPTTTFTTTMAVDESKVIVSSAGSKFAVTKTSHSTGRVPDGSRHQERRDSAYSENVLKNRGACNGHPIPPLMNGSHPLHHHNGYPPLQANYRTPAHICMPPPKVMPNLEHALYAPPHHANKAIKINSIDSTKSTTDSKPKSSSETSPSSSLYSSPPQTPSPDINGSGNKTNKKKTSDGGEDSCESAETTVVYNMPPPMVGANGDPGTPPPQHGTYPPYMNAAQHPRVNRYLPFPSHMGFLGYPPHGGLYRYPMPSQVMFGPRPPSVPPLSGSEKSSREATPPGNVQGDPKTPDVAAPHSPSVSNGVRSRVSNSASPPDSALVDLPMTHAPHAVPPTAMPYAPPNYPMYAAPYFTHYQTTYMPAHSSVSNLHSVPPSYPLPPLNSDLMYPGAYPMVNHYTSNVSNAGQNHQYANHYQIHHQGGPPPQRSKKSATCYNCGQIGHRGAECKEASMVELTRSSTTQVS